MRRFEANICSIFCVVVETIWQYCRHCQHVTKSLKKICHDRNKMFYSTRIFSSHRFWQVTGIVGRADVLAGVFFLISLLAYHG